MSHGDDASPSIPCYWTSAEELEVAWGYDEPLFTDHVIFAYALEEAPESQDDAT